MIPVSPYAVAGCGAFSAFLIALSAFPAQSPMAARIKKLERVTEKSVAQRYTIIDQIVSKEQHSRLQQRLIEAGWYGVTPVAMTMRGIGALGIGAMVCVTSLMLFNVSIIGVLIGAFAGLLAWRMPNIMLSRAVKRRKESIQRQLPDFLDLLSSTVQAGLGSTRRWCRPSTRCKARCTKSSARCSRRFAWAGRAPTRSTRSPTARTKKRRRRWSPRSCKPRSSART